MTGQGFFSILLGQAIPAAPIYDLSRMAKLPASYKFIGACGETSQKDLRF
jgi:hypothetical protein